MRYFFNILKHITLGKNTYKLTHSHWVDKHMNWLFVIERHLSSFGVPIVSIICNHTSLYLHCLYVCLFTGLHTHTNTLINMKHGWRLHMSGGLGGVMDPQTVPPIFLYIYFANNSYCLHNISSSAVHMSSMFPGWILIVHIKVPTKVTWCSFGRRSKDTE